MTNFFEKYFKVVEKHKPEFDYDGLEIEPRWKKIERIPEFAILKTCKQNPKWHSEGNAFIHTQKVTNAAINYVKANYSYVNERSEILILSALFHDIGKGVTTFEKNGIWHSYNHESEGEKITRRILWDEGFEVREKVCALVKMHMDPLNWMTKKNGILDTLVNAGRFLGSVGLTIEDLFLIKIFDVSGCISEDMASNERDIQNLKAFIRLCKSMGLTTESGIKEYDFVVNEEYKKPDEKKNLELYMIIGLPGAGKDTFIEELIQSGSSKIYINDKEHRTINTIDPSNTEVFCRDNIREELGLCHKGEKVVCNSKQEDEVTRIFNKRLLEAARKGKTVVINNINLKAVHRESILRYLSEFNINSHYIYIEADSLDVNKRRREGQIPEEVFDRMIEDFDWPHPKEYNDFYKIKNN